MNEVNKKIITRFPPSPTGGFHVGSARTAIFNYLFAKQHGGIMLLRFEDTDKERSKREYEKDITGALLWLGIEYEGGLRQSERTALYSSYIEKLIDSGSAYISDESGKSENTLNKRDTVVRFKNPNIKITFHDLIHGDISFDTTELGDFVIAKSFDEPLYHLAVVVDDFDMGVTHIIRGDDHISNTPRQILIQQAIGAPMPVYAHIPLILGPDRSKLSKRHGAKSTLEYKKDGITAEGMFNYLALLGWNPGDEREIFTKDELMKTFDIGKVQKSGAIFNPEKLLWINKLHIEKMDEHAFIEMAKQFLPEEINTLPQFDENRLRRVLINIKERVSSFGDIKAFADAGELEYYFDTPGYHKESLMWKPASSADMDEKDILKTKSHLEHIRNVISVLEEDNFSKETTKALIWNYAEQEGKGFVLWPFRYALSGVDRSPDPFTLAEILGRTETLSRLTLAIKKISEKS